MKNTTNDPKDPNNWLMVTPSYSGDFEQYTLLNKSFQRYAPEGLLHKTVVNSQDLELFQKLDHERLELSTVENTLPGFVKKVSKFWISSKFFPVRPWVLQQLIKIQCAANSERPYILFVDSDVIFLKSFSMNKFTDGTNIALSKVNNHFDDLDTWANISYKLLGTKRQIDRPKNYISNIIPWRRDTAKKMIKKIEANSRMNWLRQISSQRTISEYMLYGLYCESIGLQEAGHYKWDDPILNLVWGERMQTHEDFEHLLEKTSEEMIGVMFHSKDIANTKILSEVIHKRWEQEK